MTSGLEVFFDSDVIISSLISNKGAAYLLLNTTAIKPIISDLQMKELTIVAKRLKLDLNSLNSLIKKKLRVIKIKVSNEEIKKLIRIRSGSKRCPYRSRNCRRQAIIFCFLQFKAF